MRDSGQLPIKHNEYNPYVEKLLEMVPDLYHNLHTFRMTGGNHCYQKMFGKF